MKKIVGLGGSLREGSYSSAALRYGMETAKGMGFEAELLDLRELNLPMFTPDFSVENYAEEYREAVARTMNAFRSADVMLWVTPTYHGSMSGAFKNALDFMELLAEDKPPYLQGKAVGLVSISDSSPLIAMSACVHEVRAWLAPTRVTLMDEDFDDNENLVSASGIRRLTRLLEELQNFEKRE